MLPTTWQQLTLIGSGATGTRWRNDSFEPQTPPMCLQGRCLIFIQACGHVDNLPAPQSSWYSGAIEEVEQTVVTCLPTTRFSPIENCWQNQGNFTRTSSANLCSVNEAITDALAAVTIKDTIGCLPTAATMFRNLIWRTVVSYFCCAIARSLERLIPDNYGDRKSCIQRQYKHKRLDPN